MIRSKIFPHLALGIGLALLLSACTGLYEEGTPVTEKAEKTKTETKVELKGEPIVVGALLPLTGDGATYGIPARRVAEFSVEEINNAGGIGGRPLQFKFEDGGCNADQANNAIQKLVDVEKVKVVYGGFCSSETLAAAPIVEKNKVILFSPASSSPDITKAGDYVFRNYPSDSSQGKVLSEYAQKVGYKKVGILSEQQDYTLGIKNVFEEEFKKLEGSLVTETYLSDASDFRTQVLKLKSAKVDAYFINPQTPPKADLILKTMQEQGVKGPFILNDVAIGFQDNVTKYKDLLEGAVGAEATYDRTNPGITNLQDAYKEKYNEDLPYLTYMATSYDAVYLLKEAIEKVGYDADAIKGYLYGIKDWKGLAGSLTIDSNGDPMTGHVLRVVRGGNVEDYKE